MYYTIFIISYLFSITSCQPDASICNRGCQLLYNENLQCISHLAFVPNEHMINIDIETIVHDELYICINPNNIMINQAQNKDEPDISNPNTSSTNSMFDLDSYVLIWQAIIIAIVIPLTALLLYKLSLIIVHKTVETMQCKPNHKCACCMYCWSVEYRQQRRNRKFHNEIYNNNNNNKPWNWKWKFARKNNENNNINVAPNINNNVPVNVGENGMEIILENEYQHVPLNDMDKNGDGPPQQVLEEVSVEHNEMNKYLQAPGGNHQDIELSFSSHGLRQISLREVV